METLNQHEAAKFRVALLLKQYKFGAASAAKYLGKTRGLVQSWMQIGNNHYLAKENIKLKSFEKIVKKLRRKITEENIDYFLVMRLIDLDLPVAFISKVMELPTSTVRSWRCGKVPSEIKKFFYDPKTVDREYKKLLKYLKYETTQNNLEYYLALLLAESARENIGRRRIGGRIISQILTNHFGHIQPIPEKTISCWIDGKRKPWDAFDVLIDEQRLKREYSRIIDELTYKYLSYHLSKLLSEKYEWKYSKISKELELNKELVRGWIKKDRGNPVAKTFSNIEIVKNEVKKYLKGQDMPDHQKSQKLQKIKESRKLEYINLKKAKKEHDDENTKSVNNKLNKDLEHELIYHLETLPTGITSIKALKSILIDHQNATIQEIESVLRKSKFIVQYSGKWILKHYVDEILGIPEIEAELAKIDCEKGPNDEVIC